MIAAEAVPDSEFQWASIHFGHYGMYLAVFFTVLFIFTRVIEGSEKLAKYIPLVGKRLRERGRRKEEASADRVAEKVMERIDPPDVSHRIIALEERLDVLEQKDDVSHAWRTYDSAWHCEDELERTESGLAIKPRLTFRDFAQKYYSGLRYINGSWKKLEDIN